MRLKKVKNALERIKTSKYYVDNVVDNKIGILWQKVQRLV